MKIDEDDEEESESSEEEMNRSSMTSSFSKTVLHVIHRNENYSLTGYPIRA